MTMYTGDLRGAEFVRADLSGSRFRLAELAGVMMRGVNLEGADIDGWLDGLRINGVEVGPRYCDNPGLRDGDLGGYLRPGRCDA